MRLCKALQGRGGVVWREIGEGNNKEENEIGRRGCKMKVVRVKEECDLTM